MEEYENEVQSPGSETPKTGPEALIIRTHKILLRFMLKELRNRIRIRAFQNPESNSAHNAAAMT